MWWIAIPSALVLFVLMAFLKSPLRQAMALSLAAQRAARVRDFAAAVKYCRESHEAAGWLKDPPRSQIQSKIEILWATLLYKQGKIEEAEERFRNGFAHTRGAGCFADMKPAYVVWGDLCTDLGRHLEAERHYQTALQAEEQAGNLGGMVFALQRLGDSLIRQNRRDEAEETIQRAIQVETRVVHQQLAKQGKDPGTTRIISWSMPDLHFCREQYEDACNLYREKVDFWERSVTRPDNIDLGHLQMRLAFCEARTGHRTAALEMYARAEKTFVREWGENHPKALAAREARAALSQEGGRIPRGFFDAQHAAYRRGDYQGQLDLIDGLAIQGEEPPYCLVFRGAAYWKLGRLEEAERAVRRGLLLETRPALKTAYRGQLGRILMDRELWDEAEACFRTCIEEAPQRTTGQRDLAELLLRRGERPQIALEAARLAVAGDRAAQARGNEREKEDSSGLDESLAVYSWALAWNRANPAEVESALNEAFSVCGEDCRPTLSQIHFLAGNAQAILGNSRESSRHFQRASEIDPSGNYGKLARRLCANPAA